MVSFALEPLEACYQEMRGLVAAYIKEVQTPMGEGKVNWEHYLQLSEAGALRVVTVRDDGVLVGFLAYMVFEHPNAKGVTIGQELAMYLMPQFRKGTRAGIRLIKMAEASAQAQGAEWFTVTTRPGKPLDDLLMAIGYEQFEKPYIKRLS